MLINKLPTVYEIISGRVKAPPLGAARKPAGPKPPRPPSVRIACGFQPAPLTTSRSFIQFSTRRLCELLYTFVLILLVK